MASGHNPTLAIAPEERPRDPKKRRITSTSGPAQPLEGGPSGLRQRSDLSPISAAMERSTTPPEAIDGVRRTKTGRISKAIKGQRVHHCEECGKTYTRAEHLRRHSTNHKPGAFRCDYPDCTRAFHRDDLLTRHRARHDESPALRSRHSSLAVADSPQPGEAIVPLPSHPHHGTMPSNLSGSSASRSPASIELISGAPQPPREQPVTGNKPPRKQNIPMHDFRAQARSVSITEAHSQYDYTAQPSPQDSSDDGRANSYSHLPCMPPVQPGFTEYHPSSNHNFSASRSSISTNASGLQYWGLGAQSPAFGYSTPSSSLSYSNLHNGCNELSLYPQLVHQSLFDPVLRDNMEAPRLATPSSATFGFEGTDTNLGSWGNEERYLGAYWQNVHPIWPVVCKASFDPMTSSPLLRAAVVALGAQSIGLREDFQNAKTVHERCSKVIKQRTIEVSHSYRDCDMQAILLVEVFAVFKSRRPPLQLSRPFEGVVALLVADHLATQASGNSLLGSSAQPFDAGDVGSRPRILSSCYILDRQHAVFFGRRKNPLLDQVSRSLAYPQPHLVWDMMGAEVGGGLAGLSGSTLHHIVDSTASSRPGNSIGRDMYQCRISIAYLSDLGDQGFDSAAQEDYAQDVKSVLEFSARAALLYHTTMLCQHAHVRDLLAVAGESWVMAEKMGSQAEYTASQIDTRQWAMDASHESSPVSSALTHALEILRIHQANPKTGLLFQEWAIYLASVVIWARAYVGDESSRRLRLSIPSPTEPRASAQELEQAITNFISNGPAANITWQLAKSVLLWTKGKIEELDVPPNTCGLTNGALDVLGKLVTRGNEEVHWF
ncbi:hypothetical protein B0A48_17235 [Cryoendolithus antarcticus]|uniref:C2H2-type domain-containing protein n=1 Tax=Cryoendolithus antarcticus TaxID=1507870 RepID=A0A1V8SDA1_9PEZI|nr:hypothetical protein B0A48_17235 [Cryoendolithus antarcticus]